MVPTVRTTTRNPTGQCTVGDYVVGGKQGGIMSIYDLLAITVVGTIGFVLGVVTTIKVDSTHERIKK